MSGWILPGRRRSWHQGCCCARVCPLWARRQVFGRLVAYFRPRHFRWATIDILLFFRWPEEVNVRAFSCVKSVASKSIKLWHKHFMKMRMKVTVRYLCKVCVSCMAVVVRYHLDNYTQMHTAPLLKYYQNIFRLLSARGHDLASTEYRTATRTTRALRAASLVTLVLIFPRGALVIGATSNFKFGGIIFTKIVIEPRISPEASKTTLQ